MKKFMTVLLVLAVFLGVGFSGSVNIQASPVTSPVDDLAGRLPDDVIAFIAGSGGDSLKKAFDSTMMGRLCKDPEVVTFYNQVKGEITAKIGDQMDNSREKGIFNDVLNLAEQVISRPFIVGVAQKEPRENPVPVYGFVIIDAGGRKGEIARLIEALETLEADGEIVEVTIGQNKLHGPKNPGDLPGYWGWIGKYFVFAINDGQGAAIKNLLSGGKADYPAKLNKIKGHGDALAVYIDCQKAGALAQMYAPMMKVEKEMAIARLILNELGLSSIRQISWRSGYSGTDMVSELLVELPGEKTGLIGCVKPVDMAMLGLIDGRAVVANLHNIDLGGLYDVVLKAILTVGGPEVHKKALGMIGSTEAKLGFKIRTELLESLGGPVALYAMPVGLDGMTAGGYVLIADLKDPAIFERSMNELAVIAENFSEGMFQPTVVKKQGRRIHYWTIAPMSLLQVLPTWTIVDRKLVFASNSQMCDIAVKQILSPDKAKTSLGNVPILKQLAQKLPKEITRLSYNDTRFTMRQVRAFLQQFWPIGAYFASSQLDMELPYRLPDAEEIINQMEPTIGYAWIDAAGLHSIKKGPAPLSAFSSVGATALINNPSSVSVGVTALSVAILMPALSKAKTMAKEIQCASQLNGIGKACYLYMMDYKGKMPPNLEILVETEDLVHKMFVCPSSGDHVGQNSYVYRGADLDDSSSSSLVIAYDKKGNHPDGSRNILFVDCHVKKYSAEDFIKVMQEDNQIRRKAGLKEKPFE